MDMNKEKWINEVMNSLDEVKSAEANPFLYTRILSKISSGNVEHTPLKLVWLAAASFLLLVMLNFSIIKKSDSASSKSKNEVETLANSYQLINENSINYN